MDGLRAASLSVLALLVCAAGASAAPLSNIPQALTQPDGEVIQCLASGDEFFNWLHDSEGRIIIQNPQTGFYVYAVQTGGDIVATQNRVGKGAPEGVLLQAKMIPPIAKVRAARSVMEVGSPVSPASILTAPRSGTLNNLVIFIRFSDQSEYTDALSTYNTMFNNATAGANSMRNYFAEVSYGALTITTGFYPTPPGSTVVSYQDAHPRAYYMPYDATTNPDGYTGGDNGSMRTAREHALLANAVNAVAAQVPVELNLDGDNDGLVDNVCFIIQGGPTGWASLLWPHMWSLYSQTVYINGKRVYTYNFQLQTSLAGSGVGVLCHEMFHSLGSPDLYHYTSNGISPVHTWDVMCSNTNPPQHMGAHMKRRYGTWIASIPVITVSGTYTLNPLTSATNNCYRINSPYSATEYFVVEYRKKGITTFENGIPGSGLIVYRINSSYTGNAGGPPDEVYIYRPDGTPTANGSPSLAHFSSDVGRTVINDSTNPSSFLTSGAVGGLSIFNVTSAGSTISFTVELVPATTTTFTGSTTSTTRPYDTSTTTRTQVISTTTQPPSTTSTSTTEEPTTTTEAPTSTTITTSTSSTTSTLSTTTTLPALDVIIDNSDSLPEKKFQVLKGSWGVYSSLADKYGANYHTCNSYTGVDTSRARFSTTLLSAGTYHLYAWWTQHGSRSVMVPYEVKVNASQLAEIRVDQTVNGGCWNLLGTYVLPAGTVAIEIHNGQTGSGKSLCADAVRFVRAGNNPTTTLIPVTTTTLAAVTTTTTISGATTSTVPGTVTCIIDNTDTAAEKKFQVMLGSWGEASSLADKYGTNYRHANSSSGGITVRSRWSATTLAAGVYEVYAWWPAHSSRSTSAPYVIKDGVIELATVRVNQTTAGGQWNLLGAWTFSSGGHAIELHNGLTGTGLNVCADAVKLVRVGP